MSTLYADSPVAVRADLDIAHADTLVTWSTAGNGWTGQQRIAIVEQVRRARATEPTPPPWFRASSEHSTRLLPDAAVDAIWRLTNHPSTLTSQWHAEVSVEMTAGQYVELVGLVASACAIDVFAEAIGVDLRPLPEPLSGDPDAAFIDDVTVTTHWVPTDGDVGPMVGRALTMSPNAVATWRRLSEAQYVPWHALVGDLSYSRGALDRMQVELLAARTSLLNECFY